MPKLTTTNWDRILAVCLREYSATVRTKTFVAALLLLPFVTLFGVSAPLLARALSPDTVKQVAVIDETGVLLPRLQQRLAHERAGAALERSGAARSLRRLLRGTPPAMQFEATPATSERNLQLLALSDRVRASELFAFVVIDAKVLTDPDNGRVHYYTDAPNAPDVQSWLENAVKRELSRFHVERAGLNVEQTLDAPGRVSLETDAMFQRVGDAVIQLDAPDPIRDVGIPVGLCLLMYLCVLMSVSPLMHGVLEEKMNRVAEVLISSVSPVQLFAGKLLGALFVSYTMLIIYLASFSILTTQLVMPQLLTPHSFFAILVAQAAAVLSYGSLFLAVGSVCNDLKESQTLMMPAMGVITAPLVLLQLVVVDPDGAVATVSSMLPLFAPVLMTLRWLMPKSAPSWQVAVAIGLASLSVAFSMLAASRIFRVGMLATGGVPRYRKMLTWIISG